MPSSVRQVIGRVRMYRALALAVTWACGLACTGERTQTLDVFNAAALGPPLRDALRAYTEVHPGVRPAQLNAPSLEAVRMLTELGRVPDVLAVADVALLDSLVLPRYAPWYVRFGTNAMVLAYGPSAKWKDEISTENWYQVVTRPGVEVGRSDLRVDPSGYRADMAMQLAERHYRIAGLADALRAAIPPRNVRRAEADLSAQLSLGELDYGWTYESLARAHRLAYVRLPREVDLSDPELAAWYDEVYVDLPGTARSPALRVRGAPIVFALTIPDAAADASLARDFVEYLLSEGGRRVMERSGFRTLRPSLGQGTIPAWLAPFLTQPLTTESRHD